jgi:hypothetical protein
MTPARPCQDRFEDIVALVLGELDSPAGRELQEHLAVCDACRAARDALVVEENEVRSGFEELARGLGPVEPWVPAEQLHPASARDDVLNNHLLGRVKTMFLAHKRLSIGTAATVMAVAVGLLLYVSLFSFSREAYALEQTARANNQIKSCHVKFTPAERLSEAWIQLNPDGTPLRARMDFVKTEDGDKVVILSANKAEVWFKDKGSRTFVTEKNALARMAQMQKEYDPKLAFEALQARKESGKAQVATKASAGRGEPITLTVTSNDRPNHQEVYEVDPDTKLVQRMTTYRRQNGQWEQVHRIEYLDYNKEIDPKVFQLDLPKDVMTVDQISRKVGLEKGSLTDNEIATKVAKEFFEALIAEDYEKAGLILEGIPAAKIREMYGRFQFRRIVEIGKAVPGPIPQMQAIKVPVTVEWGGSKPWVQEFDARVPLTDDETAAKHAREFFESLAKEDHAAVQKTLASGTEFEGFIAKNADKIKQFSERFKLLRIVEVGKPTVCPESKLLEVPVKIEVEMKGSHNRTFGPLIRPVYGHPDRWGICGGI